MALYARDGVPEACLHLQGRHDLDVNLILFAAFVGAQRGEGLTASNLKAARDRVAAWHREVVRPLRAVRKRLTTGPPPAPDGITAHLRRWIQQVEIEAELIELDELGDLAASWESIPASGSPAESAALAIDAVVQASSPKPIDDLDRQAIQAIAEAAV